MTDRAAHRAPPPARVAAMFDEVVDRYDLLNSLLSLGLDRHWRRAAVRAVEAAGDGPLLDLGCGTGDLTGLLSARGPAVGVDISGGMLGVARRKLGARARLVRASAFGLPFPDATFAGAASAFVLRNLEDLEAAVAELARVIRPGGPVALADITEPRNPLVRRALDAYFGSVAPVLGGLVGKRDAYRYLARSLGQLPPPPVVVEVMEAAGFEAARARAMSGGVVTLFTARRGAGRGGRTDG